MIGLRHWNVETVVIAFYLILQRLMTVCTSTSLIEVTELGCMWSVFEVDLLLCYYSISTGSC